MYLGDPKLRNFSTLHPVIGPEANMLTTVSISRPLVKYISREMQKGPFVLQGLPVDHSIDVPFEVAKTVFMLKPREGARFDPKKQKVSLVNVI